MLYYRPENSVSGDVIPYFSDGWFHLFYLRDYRDAARMGEGTPWFHVRTKDLIHIEDCGEAIPRGTAKEQDLYVFTGSVTEKDGCFYIFYTAHNPYFPQLGKPMQTVRMAKSSDLMTWRKEPDFELCAAEGFEKEDWRDPFVFKDPEIGGYEMLLAARLNAGPVRRRGCTACARSSDLKHWQVMPEPLYAPERYYTHECPDLFQIGDWWYLLFSEFSDRQVTRYVMGRSSSGPWTAPLNDCLDNTMCYAEKTASDGKNRYLFGWTRTKENDSDEGNRQWGGNIVVHQLKQREDGTLAVTMPDAIRDYFRAKTDVHPSAACGKLQKEPDGGFSIGNADEYACAHLCSMEAETLFETEVLPDEDVREFGVALFADETCENGCFVHFQKDFQRIVISTCPVNSHSDSCQWETEKYTEIRSGEWQSVRVVVCGSVLEVYFNDEVAASARFYSAKEMGLGVFSVSGKTRFRNTKVFAKA